MNRERVVDIINKVIIAQGEIQRAEIWLSRLHGDLAKLLKELVAIEVQCGINATEKKSD